MAATHPFGVRIRHAFRPASVLVVTVLWLWPAPSGATAVLLYDVDFEAPTHVLGQPPTVGQGDAPRNTPSSLPSLPPLIAQQSGILDGQFVRFQAVSNLHTSTVEFALRAEEGGFPEQYPGDRVEADLIVHSLQGDDLFRFLFDNPSSQLVEFASDGDVYAITVGPEGYTETIATLPFGTPLHLSVVADRANEWWWISINDLPVFNGPFPVTEYPLNMGMRSVRLAMFSTGATNRRVDVDNVRIWGVPEPGTAVLLGLVLIVPFGRRRRPAANA